MLKSHEKFHSANGKRLILVVDDESVNREILGSILQNDYEVIFAADGQEAMGKILSYKDTLSLVLLDLMMPVLSGLELLKRMRADAVVQQIPVIVVTSDQKAEIESLTLGAIDFIPKPYPQAGVILARIRRTIELSEDRQIIQSTERDPLTGLYNREYFYRYAEQFDQHHKGMEMDAIVVDVNHFHMINERFGTAYGDGVLRRIGEKVREMVRDTGGIVCRRGGDTFMVYCPHGKDYRAILENASIGLAGDDTVNNRVRLRMGVYANVDKALDIERRFDRAKNAADTVRNSFTKTIGFYDSTLHESELYAEQLIEDFHTAIREQQFVVFYQPKFDIRPEIPVLASAEALVRWKHPRLGMISPGVFIPLFEENGLIQELDNFVWHKAAAQIREWKERFGISVPVSVNVSRIDMYDPHLVDIFQNLLTEYSLASGEFLLEITESAYTQDSAQIISTVNRLRSLGFQIEMDDFGTGYSSLNMISSLPIDALKLDMKFIRDAFRDGKDTRLIEVIIDIADYLSVPVIAEGVETEEQLNALKAMGCDLVQGYYFSRPLPPEEYEHFVAEKQLRVQDGAKQSEKLNLPQASERATYSSIAHALTSGFESIYYVDTANDHYVQFSSQGKYEDLQIERAGRDFFADTQRNLRRVVYSEDQPRVSLSLQKEALLTQLMGGQHFSMTYRLMIDGVPTFYNLRAVNAQTRDDHHIVIGVSNMDEQLKQANAALGAQSRSKEIFTIAQALSNDFESVYYVDADTDEYTEYTAQGPYEQLQIELSGTDFFTECQKNLRTVVYAEDQERVSLALQKDRLLHALKDGQTSSVLYRLLIDGVPTYFRMIAVKTDRDGHHIVIGVSNVDEQVAREQELEASQEASVTYARIAQALAQDYFSIYYVDTETERFMEYSMDSATRQLTLERSGEAFFDDCKRSIPQVVVPEDQERALAAFDRETLLKELEGGKTFSISYRLLIRDVPTYASLKALRLADDNRYIVIGISNIDAQMRKEREYEAAVAESVTYASIAQALSKDYYSIYYVNVETDEFIEYSSDSKYQELHVEQSGINFFEDCRRNILRLVYPEDKETALSVWEKSRLLPELESGSIFSVTYRLLFNGEPVYINCKVIRMTDGEDDKHIVIGVSNVDAQMRREQELDAARQMANRDALTGVKSKHAYVQAIDLMNERLAAQENEPFSLVVCDVNGLKTVNDTQGHQAGDRLIQSACRIICTIFAHSPVYRIGGDEFVAILRGQDYEHRSALMERIGEHNRQAAASGGVIIANGSADYLPGQDATFADVFARADAAMYENKKLLKRAR